MAMMMVMARHAKLAAECEWYDDDGDSNGDDGSNSEDRVVSMAGVPL